MDSKTAAANSLYIIMFSQFASLVSTLVLRKTPSFSLLSLCLMVGGGILGSMCGRALNKKMNNTAVDKLFIGMMSVIIFVCVYNAIRYFS